MAKEFLILETLPRSNGDVRYNYISLYAIDPIIEVEGIAVVETPSASLPEIVEIYGLMSSAEKMLLDSGEYVFQEDNIMRSSVESIPHVIGRMTQRWERRNAHYADDLRAKYNYTGTWVNI